jgi:hypothetical protein
MKVSTIRTRSDLSSGDDGLAAAGCRGARAMGGLLLVAIAALEI